MQLADFVPYLRGLGIGAGLIVAIGAQNAFVLRQGLLRRHVFPIALTCAGCDALLIALGAGGFGTIVAAFPALTTIAAIGGAAFLFYYGLRSFRAALTPDSLTIETEPEKPQTVSKVLLTTLAFSLLNPHVYLDTVVLLGGISAQYTVQPRLFFAFGAISASFLWFFGLAYGAAYLAPLFRKPMAWRILDIVIGIVMCTIAASLILPILRR